MFQLAALLFFVLVSTRAASTNDFFLHRVLVTGSTITSSAQFTGATREAAEPHEFPASLWWEWVAPETRNYAVEIFAPNTVPPAALVFTGTWPNLTLVSSPAPAVTRVGTTTILQGYSRVSLRAQAGTRYYLAAAGFTNQTEGFVSLRILNGPANDDFANATVVTGSFSPRSANLHGATAEPGEVLLSTNSGGATVWWQWRPERAGRFAIKLADNGFAAHLGIYRGTDRTNLQLVASGSSDPVLGGVQLIRDFDGAVYYLTAQDAWKQLGTLTLSAIASSENDDFENRTVLEGTNILSQVRFAGATRQPGEPAPPQVSGTIWFEWTAAFDGGIALEATSGAMGPGLAVYTGSSLTNLVEVGQPPAPYHNRIGFRALAGERYFIAVHGSSADNATVNLRLRPGPANDNFAFAQAVNGPVEALLSSLHGATQEPHEPLPRSASVWFKWTPGEQLNYSLEARSLDTILELEVFSGTELTNLTRLARARNGSGTESARLTIAGASEPLYLRVLYVQGTPSSFHLYVRAGPAHDEFVNAAVISELNAFGTTRGALAQHNEKELGAGEMPTVWHRWIPEKSGGYEIRVSGGQNGNAVSLFSGSSPDNLRRIAALESFSVSAESINFRANAGEIYYLLVSGKTPGGDSYWLNLTPGPANDDFVNRIPLTTPNPAGSALLVGATREPGEPPHSGDRTVWWEWTAPFTGGIALRAQSRDQALRLTVYQGTEMTNLTVVPARLVYLNHVVEQNFRAIAGERYQIVISGSGLAVRDASFTSYLAATNDSFANAIAIAAFDQAYLSSAIGATLEPGEPPARGSGATLWYSWTAPRNGTFAVIGDNNSQVTVFHGNALSNLVEIASNSPRSPISVASFRALEGDKVHIRIDGPGDSVTTLQVTPAAANDDFAKAAVITDPSRPVVIPIFLATAEAGEPLHVPGTTPKSLWWKFTAPVTAGYRIRIPAVDRTAYVAVYTGNGLSRLVPVAARSGENDLALTFRGIAGTEYHIAFGQEFENYGPYEMFIERSAPNDDFATAAPLILGQTSTNRVTAATLEFGEPIWTDSLKVTVWFSWTAPTNGNYLLAAAPDLWKPHLAVFTGGTLAELNPVAIATNWTSPGSSLVFPAQAGVNYQFAVAITPADLDVPLTVLISPAHAHDSFVNPAELSGAFTAWTNTTLGASSEPGETGGTIASVWARWISPSDGYFRTIAQNGNVQIFTGGTLAETIAVGTSTNGIAEFLAQAGREYRLRVSTPTNGMRDFVLRLAPKPPNDERAQATEIAGTNVAMEGWTWNSTAGSGEQRPSIWWAWRAPADGIARVRSLSTNQPIYFTARHTRDNTFETIIGVPGAQINTNATFFAATAGQVYHFEVATLVPSTNVTIYLDFSPSTPLPEHWRTALPGFLLGGTLPWEYNSAENILETGPLASRDYAWLEAVYPGPGLLRFWWRRSTLRPNLYFAAELGDGGAALAPNHTDWAEAVIPLLRATNLVRWSVAHNVPRGGTGFGSVYLSNVVFVPTPARAANLIVRRSSPEALQLIVPAEAQRNYVVERSTNLLEWTQATNFFTSTVIARSFYFPIQTNNSPVFFRAYAR